MPDDPVAGARRRAAGSRPARPRRPRSRRGRTRPAPSASGCSDISPPSSAAPACRQPSATPLTISSTVSGIEPCPPRGSRGRTAARRPARRCRRRSSRRSRCRSCRSGSIIRAIDRLRADAVGRRARAPDRGSELAEREQPAEPADVADDLGPEGRADVRLDQLDRLLAGADVDAGVARRSGRRSASRLRRRRVTRSRRRSTR